MNKTADLQLPAVHAEYVSEVGLEHARWSEITGLLGLLTPEERIVPGYFRDSDWTVKDLVAHLGAWLSEAATQLTSIAARSYEARDLDVDAQNAKTLAALREVPWDEAWRHATGARAIMLQHWFALRVRSDAADLWVRKASPRRPAGTDGKVLSLPAKVCQRRVLREQRTP